MRNFKTALLIALAAMTMAITGCKKKKQEPAMDKPAGAMSGDMKAGGDMKSDDMKKAGDSPSMAGDMKAGGDMKSDDMKGDMKAGGDMKKADDMKNDSKSGGM